VRLRLEHNASKLLDAPALGWGLCELLKSLLESETALPALYRHPIKGIAGARRILEVREQNAAPLDATAIRKLVSQISGHAIALETPDYESSSLVFNRAFDRHPALIVRCAGAPDVARALEFAQNQNLPLAVRAE
jgi:hypothetical protein